MKGELGFAYAGLRPDDPSLEPYFALAEEFDMPVAIHMAGGGLGDVPAFRVRLGDPLLLEDVLARHPKLRVNLMHAGLPFLEGTLAIMRRYPEVFADLSKISDANASGGPNLQRDPTLGYEHFVGMLHLACARILLRHC
jgi:predicted TIM-barrel fold metal-dependent hydrolase